MTKNDIGRECLTRDKSNHRTADYFVLQRKNAEERTQFVKEHRLCWSCLEPGHQKMNCKSPVTCRTCKEAHPSALHHSYLSQRKTGERSQNHPAKSGEAPQLEGTALRTRAEEKIGDASSMTFPVWVHHKGQPDKEVLVYALLDSGSTMPFILKNTAELRRWESQPTIVKLTMMTGSESIIKS